MVFLSANSLTITYPVTLSGARHDAHQATAEPLQNRIRIRGKRALVEGIHNISLQLGEGDRLAVVGRNGAGKTTLLRALAGILLPETGEVIVEGRCTNLININVGMQANASGHENITFHGLLARQSKDAIEEARAAIVEFAELGEFMDLPISSYSSGMRMRLNFAIVTAFKPQILLLDEWLGTGDAVFSKKANERMRTFVEQAGILVLGSHNRKLLKDNCNLGLWLDNGEMREFGEIAEVLGAYDKFVQR